MSLLEVRDLARHFHLGGEVIRPLDGVSFRIEPGEYVAIIGPSGSGKSSLMNLLGCLDSPTAGSYRLEGREVADLDGDQLADVRNRRIGFVFQSFHLLPRQTARENVALPLLYGGSSGARAAAEEALARVGLGDRLTHRPAELSGGQCQRVAIARALVNRPALVLADEPTGNLDSVTSRELLDLLDELHAAGTTIVLVTHDPRTAERAHRVLEMLDGRVLVDRVTERAERAAPVAPEGAAPPERRGSLGLSTMARVAGASLWEAKLRTALSMLGMVIGVAAVIAMLGLGQGARESVSASIGNLGTNLLMVRSGFGRHRHVRSARVQTLVPEDAGAILAEVPQVEAVAPEVEGSAQVKYYQENAFVSVNGTSPSFLKVRSYELARGRFFDEREVRTARKVCVLGATTATTLFGETPAVGERLKLKGRSFEVVGVLRSKGDAGWRDPDDVVLVPYTTAMRKLFGVRHLRSINVSVRSREETEAAIGAITALLRRRHRIREGEDPDFQIRSQDELLRTMGGVAETFTLLLAGIAAVSLLVGGIGIMNIMLVSVTERTREIGIRKALGATRGDVLRQFLTEALVITLTGGVLGVLLGLGASRLLAHLSGWTVVVPAFAYPLAFGFSAGIGVFFGAYPAARAAALDPIESLRHE